MGIQLGTCLYQPAGILANQQYIDVWAELIKPSFSWLSPHSLDKLFLQSIYLKLVFPAETTFHGAMPLYPEENFSQKKMIWGQTQLEMHLLDMTLEYRWKLFGLNLVYLYLHGLCSRAINNV